MGRKYLTTGWTASTASSGFLTVQKHRLDADETETAHPIDCGCAASPAGRADDGGYTADVQD